MIPGERFFVIALLAIILAAGTVQGREYYVAVDGSDSDPGTLEQPFRTIRKAAGVVRNGDTCYVRSGSYHETVALEDLHGTADQPIVFAAHKDENVILDGSEPITSQWVKHQGSIYKTTLEKDIWQLFYHGRMMMAARWPNARFEDESIWDQDRTWAHGGRESSYGTMVTRTDDGRPDLAATGKDFTGAIAVLNVGKWISFSRKVLRHEAGSGVFNYSPNFHAWLDQPYMWDDHHKDCQRYYLECHLNCLDAPGEWYYNPESKELFFWPPDGKNPADNVRGQTQEYAFDVSKSSHVTISGFKFFGTTFRLLDSHHCTVEDCDLIYYAHSKRMLGVEDWPAGSGPDGWTAFTRNEGSYNTIRNCKFEYADGAAFISKGHHHTVDNVLVHDIDWSGCGMWDLWYRASDDTTYRRITAYNCGASECIEGGRRTLVEFCNFGPHIGDLQQDGAIVQISPPFQPGTIIRYNWIHGSPKFGIRADFWPYTDPPSRGFGRDMTVHHNVVWGIGKRVTDKPAIHLEGNEHFAYNNTVYGNDVTDICLADATFWKIPDSNDKTVVKNNAAFYIGMTRQPSEVEPRGIIQNNWNGNVWEQLRDPANRDFRPRDGSDLIDTGVPIDGVPGEVPDIGAYEHGTEHYWIPGYQSKQASNPIPADRAKNAKPDTHLIWLEGYKTNSHDVYFGVSKESVERANRESQEFKGNQRNNIFAPGELKPGVTYYWRIDAVGEAYGRVTGSMWQFESGHEAEQE